MKALVWHGKEDVRVDQVDDPKIEEETDAIVRITSTAICGSDLHLYSKLYPALKEGDILGHEPMGVVEEVGSAVTHIKPGDRVVMPFNVSCGLCFMCAKDLQSQCETTQNKSVRKGASLFGYTHMYGGIPGGQAEYLRVPQAHYGPIKVPEGPSDDRYLYLSDVLPTAWQAVAYGDVQPGDTVVVYGLGPIGQMCGRIARHAFGAARIIGVDQVPDRLALAEEWDFETIDFSSVGDPTNAVSELTNGRGADVGIDAVGLEAAGSLIDSLLSTVKLQPDKLVGLHHTMGSIRRGGTLSISGVYMGAFPAFPVGDLFDKQITIRQGQANVRRWVDDILPLLEGDDDPLGVESFASHHRPLEEAPDAYEKFQEKADGHFKVVLKP